MNLDAALRDLAEAVAVGKGPRGRAAVRQVLLSRCVSLLNSEVAGQPSIAEVIRMAMETPRQSARRACAVLFVHALAVPGLVPTASASDVCALIERGLRSVLLRCGYPFGESIEVRMHVLERLHTRLDELMQPLQPTFPNWQGLYAG